MEKNSFIRVMAAIALMLAVGLHAEAQLGKKIMQRAKNAAETKAQMEADRAVNKGLDKTADAVENPQKGDENAGTSGDNRSSGQRPPKSTWKSPMGPYVTDEMIETAKEMNKRNNKDNPPPWVLASRAEEGGGSTNDTRKNHANLFIQLSRYAPDSIRSLKAQTEARHAENMRYFAMFKDTTGFAANENDIKTMKNAKWKPEIVNKDDLFALESVGPIPAEIERYYLLMDRARSEATRFGKFGQVAENRVTIPSIQVGVVYTAQVNGKTVFCRNVDGKNVITPADEEMFNTEYAKYQNLATLLRKEPPAEQYPEYAGAQLAAQEISMAQKNAIAMEVKQPIPAPKMNDAALTAKMLKLAQAKYPEWGIVKLVIAESAWRPEKNALGNIIHRRINTKIILPRKSGGYIMRTLSFIEPYAGGGKYGEAQTFGIGTDETAVDYQ